MRRNFILVMVMVFALACAMPANADFLDKVNGFLDNVNDKLAPLNNGGVATPPIVASSGNSRDYNGGYDSTPSGDPETGLSQKALEAMAALGDPWARMKLDEVKAKDYMDNEYNKYKSTSWFNVFSKVGTYFDYKSSKKFYEEAQERTREYKQNNPNAGGIIEGIDEINESVLEFKALFGNKEAKAKLELIRSKREYDRLAYEYEEANMFQKMGMKSDLNYAKKRYENAVAVYAQVKGVKSAPSANVNPSSNNVVSNNNNNAQKFAKDRMDAAYKRYMSAINSNNPNTQQLQMLKQEYEMTLSEFKRVSR